MPATQYQAIHKAKIEAEIYARYQHETDELRQLGFGELQYIREVVFPFSAVLLFWMIPVMLTKRKDIFRIESPLRFVLMHPLMLNRDYSSYAAIDGDGVTFITHFVDDMALLTSNHEALKIQKPEKKYVKFVPDFGEIRSLPATWQRHQQCVEDYEGKGRETNDELMLTTFEKIIQRGDKLGFQSLGAWD